MDHSKIQLDNFAKSFEYEKLSREIDSCNDLSELKNIAKAYIKLFFKQQETLTLLIGEGKI